MKFLIKIFCKILKFIEELIMTLIPTMCGTNELYLPKICDEAGRFVGVTDVTIVQGSDFDPLEGVYATDKEGNLISYDVSPSEIDTCEVGNHTLLYTTELYLAERTVTVAQASAPTISGLTTATVGYGDTLDTLDGVSATDANGNTVEVTCTEGSSITFTEGGIVTLHYTAEDACGNTATATRTVVVRAGWFEGIEDITVTQGTDVDLTDGVTAYDADGNEIGYTVTPSEFVPCTTGEQEYVYSASGSASVTRTITVTQIANPTISGISTALNVNTGEDFDPLDGVTAVDGNGNTITVTAQLL